MDSLAAVFRDVRKPMSIERITLDPPGPTEVLVRIAAVGLCRTDYHVMRGERRVAMRPMVLGHEAAGIVEELGAAVNGIKAGDHVILTFIPACEICHWCRQGLHHLCAAGPRITQGPQLDGCPFRKSYPNNMTISPCRIPGVPPFRPNSRDDGRPDGGPALSSH